MTVVEQLHWHYGPTADDPDPGAMWHYDCGGRVMAGDNWYSCIECHEGSPVYWPDALVEAKREGYQQAIDAHRKRAEAVHDTDLGQWAVHVAAADYLTHSSQGRCALYRDASSEAWAGVSNVAPLM